MTTCKKRGHWSEALALFWELPRASVLPNVISCSIANQAAEEGNHWTYVLELLWNLKSWRLELNHVCYTAGIKACGKAER